MMRFKRKPDCEMGSAAVEFALCLPILLMILTLIIDYGWYFANELVLINAVSTGARAGIKAREWDGEDPVALAINAAQEAFWLGSINPTAVRDDTMDPERIVVQASITYMPITGYLPGNLLPSRVAAKAVMTFP